MQIGGELDYQKQNFSHPQYKMNKISTQNGTQTATISGGGGSQSIFEIPANLVYNLAKSKLYFTMTVPEEQIAGPANGALWIPKDCASMIAQLQLYNRAGVYLCDLNYVQNYTKVINKPETSMSEYLQYDTAGINAPVAVEAGLSRFLRKSNSVANSATRTALAPYAKRPTDDSNASINYLEPQYAEPGVIYDGAGAGNVAITFCVPLEHFRNSVLACDKDLYFGEPLLLRIVWSPVNRISWLSSAVNDPDANSEAPDGDVAISELNLYLASETNSMIVNALKQKVSSGQFSMLIPYVHSYKTNLGGANQNISLRFNRQHGERLLKVYSTVFNNTETTCLAYDNDNTAGAKVTSYYTSLNNNRLQDFNVTVANDEDWLLHMDLVKNSVIQNVSIYKYNWFHVDDFGGIKLQDTQGAFNVRTGLPLDIEQKLDVNYTTAGNNLNHYNFAVTQRVLNIGAGGITVQ